MSIKAGLMPRQGSSEDDGHVKKRKVARLDSLMSPKRSSPPYPHSQDPVAKAEIIDLTEPESTLAVYRDAESESVNSGSEVTQRNPSDGTIVAPSRSDSGIKGTDIQLNGTETWKNGADSNTDVLEESLSESDDDIVEVDPEEAAKMEVFKDKPRFNQPAPGVHFGPGSNRVSILHAQIRDKTAFASNMRSQLQDQLTKLNSIQQLVKNRLQRKHHNAMIRQQDPSAALNDDTLDEDIRIAKGHYDTAHRAVSALRSNVRRVEQDIAKDQQELLFVQTNTDTGTLTLEQREAQLLQQLRQQRLQNQHPEVMDLTSDSFPSDPEYANEIVVRESTQHGYPSYYASSTQDESEQIKDLLDNIRTEESEATEDLPATPADMRNNLYKHQRMGLAWLMRMEQSNSRGGILADDMGLGKTIQSIALMMAHKSLDSECKTTLIIAPVSLLRQWANEIQLHTKWDVSIGIYHGSGRNKLFKTFEDFQRYDVIMTSYTTLSMEFKKHYKELFASNHVTFTQNVIPDHGTGGTVNPSPFYTKGSKFYRIILDEAQNIKNKVTVASKAVTVLDATYRWCLTGTPMQNSIDELYPIIRFLRIKPYANELVFRSRVSGPLKNKNGREELADSLNTLRALLKAILLRRSKTSTIDGEPILQLPAKHVEDITIKMDELEFENYQAIEQNLQTKAKRLFMEDSNFSNFLVLLLRLRQACCHSFLCVLGNVGKLELYRSNHFKELFRTIERLDPATEKVMMQELASKGEDENELEIIDLDALTGVQTANTLLELKLGSAEAEDQLQEQLKLESVDIEAQNYGEPEPMSIDVESDIKPEVDLTNIDDEDPNEDLQLDVTDTKLEDVTDVQPLKDEQGVFTCPLCFITYTYKSVIMFPCEHKICEDCIDSFVEDNKENENGDVRCYECSTTFKPLRFIDYRLFYMRNYENKLKGQIQTELDDAVKGKQMMAEKIKKLIIKHQGFVYSTKMTEILKLIENVFTNFPGEKIIVFSQFTSFFDLMKIMFNKSGIPFLRYDGTMSVEKKDDTVKQFYQNDRYKVMLTSLKAGNVGLTLNCASHVIITDPFWNPYVEEQAQDRAHRIGQTKEVYVYRVLLEGTVEERIIALQNKKKELINAALDENGMKSVSRLSRRDLGYLFGFNSLAGDRK